MSDKLTYKSSGVDIDKASGALGPIARAVARTHGPEVLSGIGGFGGVYRISENQALVCSIDGVGTKTKVAQMARDYSGIGADIVNHCVNDILCQGARPLLFLDYFGCSSLDSDALTAVVEGAAQACQEAGCALIGGETAEMPGVYAEGEFDIVGAIVGTVDPEQMLPSGVREGDVLLGLPSAGLHTNGFSMARKALFDVGGLSLDYEVGDQTLAEALLTPHRCYLRALRDLSGIHGLAHVTGGGIPGNLSRVIPEGLCATVDARAWDPPPVFDVIQEAGNIDREEMFRAFNMGIGMVVIASAGESLAVAERIESGGCKTFRIGEIVSDSERVRLEY